MKHGRFTSPFLLVAILVSGLAFAKVSKLTTTKSKESSLQKAYWRIVEPDKATPKLKRTFRAAIKEWDTCLAAHSAKQLQALAVEVWGTQDSLEVRITKGGWDYLSDCLSDHWKPILRGFPEEWEISFNFQDPQGAEVATYYVLPKPKGKRFE